MIRKKVCSIFSEISGNWEQSKAEDASDCHTETPITHSQTLDALKMLVIFLFVLLCDKGKGSIGVMPDTSNRTILELFMGNGSPCTYKSFHEAGRKICVIANMTSLLEPRVSRAVGYIWDDVRVYLFIFDGFSADW